MQNFAFIVALLVVGKACSLTGLFPRDTAKSLSQFVIFISLPALILVQVRRLTFDAHVAAPILAPWVLLAVSAGLVLMAGRVWGWSRSTIGALLLVVPLGNTSFLGIPMVEAFLGRECVPYAVLYDQLGTFLALATYGTTIVAVYAEQAAPRPAALDIVKKVLLFPPFIALVVAFSARSLTVPAALETALQRLADTLIPVVMIAVGFQFRLRLPMQVAKRAAFGLGVKMVAAPLLALAVVAAIGAEHPALRTSVLEAGMPPQISAGAVAIAAGLEPELVGAMVGLGILLAPLTLWGLHALM